ncbi:MAG: hypothetical protein J7L38_06340 [Thermoproteales archaeon]|nr:hypothetical protein [Thermoproteales archaeon]
MHNTRFIVDSMLGDVAKWLRILGYFALYRADYDDEEILRTAKQKKLWILTRDKQLVAKAKKMGLKATLLPQATSIVETLAFMSKNLGLKLEIDFEKTRCPKCNGILEKRFSVGVGHAVPENIKKNFPVVLVCKSCGAVYWPGSHYRMMLKILREASMLRRESEGVDYGVEFSQ